MAKTDQNIRDIFQQKLSGHELPVDPSMWTNISSGLSGGGAVSGWAALSSLSQWTIVTVGAVAVVALTLVGVDQFKDDQTAPVQVQSSLTENQPGATQKALPLATDEAEKEETESTPQIVHAPQKPNDAQELVTESPSSTQSTVKTENEPVKTNKFQIPAATGSYQIARGADMIAEQVQTELNSSQSEDVIDLTAEFNAIRASENSLSYTFIPMADENWKYDWKIGDNRSSLNTPNYEFEAEGEHTVRLTVTDEGGHYEVHEVVLQVYHTPSITEYNVITPNADGLNDVLDLDAGAVNAKINNLVVLDQQNRVVFESHDNHHIWDGTDPYGNPCEKGSYFYQYEAKTITGDSLQGRGIVSLL